MHRDSVVLARLHAEQSHKGAIPAVTTMPVTIVRWAAFGPQSRDWCASVERLDGAAKRVGEGHKPINAERFAFANWLDGGLTAVLDAPMVRMAAISRPRPGHVRAFLAEPEATDRRTRWQTEAARRTRRRHRRQVAQPQPRLKRRSEMKSYTRAFKRILIEAKKFREENPELTHAKAVQPASELHPHLVEKHREQLRLGLVEKPDDAPIQASERGVSAVKVLRHHFPMHSTANCGVL